MSQIAIAPAPVIVKTPAKPLAHLFCECQRSCPGGRRLSYCGAELSGAGMPLPKDMIDICVLCHEIKGGPSPCKHCGRA